MAIKSASARRNDSAKDVKKNKHSGLTIRELRELKLQLEELRSEIVAAIDERAQLVCKSAHDFESAIKGDDAEVAEKQRINNSALQEIDILKARLVLVQNALSKMSQGLYGICEESEEPIGFERLTAVPWARYCVSIQEVRERRQREFRKVSLKPVTI